MEFLSLADTEMKTVTAERDEARTEIHVLRVRVMETMTALQKPRASSGRAHT